MFRPSAQKTMLPEVAWSGEGERGWRAFRRRRGPTPDRRLSSRRGVANRNSGDSNRISRVLVQRCRQGSVPLISVSVPGLRLN